MTSEQIMTYVDFMAAEFSMEERRHFKRFFLHEYCSAWMPIRAIALATGVTERSMVYRSIKIIQTNRDYWFMAHSINTAIKKQLPNLKSYKWLKRG